VKNNLRRDLDLARDLIGKVVADATYCQCDSPGEVRLIDRIDAADLPGYTPPDPSVCERCGRPYGPNHTTVEIVEVVVATREEAEMVERLSRENGHES
jgi:hypothetical protein